MNRAKRKNKESYAEPEIVDLISECEDDIVDVSAEANIEKITNIGNVQRVAENVLQLVDKYSENENSILSIEDQYIIQIAHISSDSISKSPSSIVGKRVSNQNKDDVILISSTYSPLLDLQVGTLVKTPFGMGSICEDPFANLSRKVTPTTTTTTTQSTRKRRRGTASEALRSECIVSVRLPFGIGHLNIECLETYAGKVVYRNGASEILDTDIARLNSKMMINDNIVNFALDDIRQKCIHDNVGIASTFLHGLISSYMANKRISESEKVRKIMKLLTPFLKHQYIIIPISGHLHWSLAVLCNISKVLSRESLPSNEDFPCIMILDSSKYHRTQSNTAVYRKALQLILNDSLQQQQYCQREGSSTMSPMRTQIASSAVSFDVSMNEMSEFDESLKAMTSAPTTPANTTLDTSMSPFEDAGVCEDSVVVNAGALPSVTANVHFQTNDFDCGIFIIEFSKLLSANPPIITKAFLENKGDEYFRSEKWIDTAKVIDNERQRLRLTLMDLANGNK